MGGCSIVDASKTCSSALQMHACEMTKIFDCRCGWVLDCRCKQNADCQMVGGAGCCKQNADESEAALILEMFCLDK